MTTPGATPIGATAVADSGSNGDGFPILPRDSYFAESWFERELDRIFLRHWLYAGHESEIAAPGDFMTRAVGGESVLIVRNRDGGINAFFNVCRHRGARVCPEVSGTAKRFVCPYHRWTYGLDGRLLGAPGMGRLTDLALAPAHVASWNGLVFVNLSEEPPQPLEELLGPVRPAVARFDVPSCKVAATMSYTVAANWKLVLENYYECYHCPGSHPELCQTFDLGVNPGGEMGERPHPLVEYGSLPLKEGARSLTMTGERACSRTLGRLSDDDLPASMGVSLHPSTSCLLWGDYGIVFDFQPTAPIETRVRCQWLVAADAEEDRDYDPEALIELWDVTNRQDWPLCEGAQAGVMSRRYVPGPLNAEREPAIRGFRLGYLSLLG